MIFPIDSPECADKILEAFSDICNQLDIIWFIHGGTALGFIRDGFYIPDDNDLDVGVFCESPEQSAALIEGLINAGFAPDPIPCFAKMHFWREDMLLDIRGIEGDWGGEWMIDQCLLPYIQGDLDKITYRSREYLVPHSCENYLVCCYGNNWRVHQSKAPVVPPIVVFAPLCADPLHIGHVRWLEKASRLGNYLIAGVCTDEFMESYKGRPVMPYEQRREIVAALRCVDYAEPFAAFDDYLAIKKHGVSIYVVDDLFPSYEAQSAVKAELIQKGISYVTIPRTPNISSAQIKKDCCHSLCHSNDCGLHSVWLRCSPACVR